VVWGLPLSCDSARRLAIFTFVTSRAVLGRRASETLAIAATVTVAFVATTLRSERCTLVDGAAAC